MTTIGDIRRQRLRLLMQEHALTLVALNKAIGRLPRDATLSQVLNGALNSGTKKPRQMGDAQARMLEAHFNKPTGWMDRDPLIDELEAKLATQPAVTYPAPVASPPLEARESWAPSLTQAIETLGLGLAREMPPELRQDVADALAKLAQRKGDAVHQQHVVRLLQASPAADKQPRAA